jgi:hypothetical protein
MTSRKKDRVASGMRGGGTSDVAGNSGVDSIELAALRAQKEALTQEVKRVHDELGRLQVMSGC